MEEVCAGRPATARRQVVLDAGGDAALELELDLVGPDLLDRLLQVDLAAVDSSTPPSASLDRLGDVLVRDRAEEAPIPARLAGRSSGPSWPAARRARRDASERRLLGLGGRGRELCGGGDAGLRCGLGELARDEVVPQVALGDVDDGTAGPEILDVLEEDRLQASVAVAVTIAVTPAAADALVRGLRGVRHECELTRALDRAGELALVTAAEARDAARADLPRPR